MRAPATPRGRIGLTLLAALAVVLAGAVAAPGASADEDAYYVDAGDDFFSAEVIRVEVGETVEWVNIGRNPHTVTADDGSFDSGDLQPGAEFSWTFTEPGVYPYYCVYHGGPGGVGMAGIVVVGDVPLPGGDGGVGPGREPVPQAPGATIRIPQDAATIQAGVDAASPGDLVLVGPGVYPEAVRVTTPYLTIRGTDRNAVILDGGFHHANGIHVAEADGVVVENMTARHYQLNGFYWSGVNGYRGSYLTAYGNGDYGLYAYGSTWGRFDHSYASGHPDSGFYIGECQPCHAVISDVLAEGNALGYSGTNAGGDLLIVNSEWRDNMSGIVPNTLDSERLAPQRATTIQGNWVHDNDNPDAPAKRLQYPTLGNGIILIGGRDTVVEGNLVEDHSAFGIAVLPNLDDNLWLSSGNRVENNLVRRSGRADLTLGLLSAGGDCFAGNGSARTLPPLLEVQYACGDGNAPRPGGGAAGATFGLLTRFAQALNGHATGGDWRDTPEPPAQPSMPDPESAPVLAVPEAAVPGPTDIPTLDELQARAAAADDGRTASPEVTFMGIPLAASPLSLLIGLYGYVFPLILYVAWVVLALWDLARREELASGARLGWTAAVLAIPLVGPLAYLFAGGSRLPLGMRLLLVVGGVVFYVLLFVLGLLLA
jgi:plastocyanin